MKVAIIGSTHAGTFSAIQVKQQHPDAEVTVFEQHTTVSFLSCGIALWLGDHVSDEQRMFYETPTTMTDKGIIMKMQHEVVAANLAEKSVQVKDLLTGEISSEIFDKIVITTGSDRKSTRLNSSHKDTSRMPSSA